MDTREITHILKRDRFTKHYFRGVYACDTLPKEILPRLSALVVNTDPSDQPGQHWVAIYLTRNGVCEYFDSYGKHPNVPQIASFLEKNSQRSICNSRRLQGTFSTVCGQYVTFFLLHRCRDLSMAKTMKLFTSDTPENDLNVNNFIRTHFPRIKTEVYDETFINGQISRGSIGTSSFDV